MRENGKIFVECKRKDIFVSYKKVEKAWILALYAFIKSAIYMKYMRNCNDILDVS